MMAETNKMTTTAMKRKKKMKRKREKANENCMHKQQQATAHRVAETISQTAPTIHPKLTNDKIF